MEPKLFYYSISSKREVDSPESVPGEVVVQCYKMVVYGTLRQNDSAYQHFLDCFVCRNSGYYLLENYRKVHYGPYFAVEPEQGSVVDCEVFYIYPDTIELFDKYESVDSGLYHRVVLEDGCFIYVKGSK